jgi:hypothetical protein
MNSRYPSWQLMVVVLFFLGIGAAIFYPDNCPTSCKVALFSNSDEVTDIVARAQIQIASSSVVPISKTQSSSGVKNKPPVPVVETSLSDGKGNVLIVAADGSIILLIQGVVNNPPRCTVIHPKVDAKWCVIRNHL